MAAIIEHAHRVYKEKKVRFFKLRTEKGRGYQFDVVDGKVIFPNELAEINYLYCLGHPEEYEDKGIIIEKTSYWEWAKAICECGKEIYLKDTYWGAGQCEYCGRWHNLFGQELLPIEEWGAEEDAY